MKVTCPDWRQVDGKPCLHYIQGGHCALPKYYLCIEYRKQHGLVRRSDMASYMRCPKLYWWSCVQGVELVAPSQPIIMGLLAHEYLANWHSTKDPNYKYKGHDRLPEIEQIKQSAVLQCYNPDDSLPLHGESECKLDDRKLGIVGKADLVVTDGSAFWEHKYTSKPDNYTKWSMTLQFGTYFLGLPSAERVILNLIRHPQLKYNEKKETPEEFAQRLLEDIQRRKQFYYIQTVYYRQEFDLQALTETWLAWKRRLTNSILRNEFPHNYRSCFSPYVCDYIKACEFGLNTCNEIYSQSDSLEGGDEQ